MTNKYQDFSIICIINYINIITNTICIVNNINNIFKKKKKVFICTGCIINPSSHSLYETAADFHVYKMFEYACGCFHICSLICRSTFSLFYINNSSSYPLCFREAQQHFKFMTFFLGMCNCTSVVTLLLPRSFLLVTPRDELSQRRIGGWGIF